MASTDTPWAANGLRIESRDQHGWANDGWIVAECMGPDAEGNAHLIAHAVNNHAPLSSALAAAHDWIAAMEAEVVNGRAKGKDIQAMAFAGHRLADLDKLISAAIIAANGAATA